MGANIRELRDRVNSVKNTRKITSAMRLVAAAKVRRAQDAVLKTRPFSETLQKVLGGLIVRLKRDNFESPLFAERPVSKVLLVIMTGDRGLCGGYNTFAIKKAEARIAELKKANIPFDLVTIGRKGTQYFSKRYNVVNNYAIGNAPTAAQATEISDALLATFLSGEADRVELLYTRFTSLIASEPSIRTMLPLSPTGIESEGDEIFLMTSKGGQFAVEAKTTEPAAPKVFPKDMIFEQDPEQILSAILPLYFNGQILRQMQESVASELAARMTAMQSASDNAKDLITDLSRQVCAKSPFLSLPHYRVDVLLFLCMCPILSRVANENSLADEQVSPGRHHPGDCRDCGWSQRLREFAQHNKGKEKREKIRSRCEQLCSWLRRRPRARPRAAGEFRKRSHLLLLPQLASSRHLPAGGAFWF
jgi:F-type H+-transporting ATPase subunit gamma